MDNLVVTPPPHLKVKATVSEAMRDVAIALVPVSIVSIIFFQLYAVLLIAVCVGTAALTEVIFRRAMKKQPTLHDYSAVLTGLFVALLFSPTAAWWSAVLATFIAVGIAKELMGGLGWNLFNPALFGRVAIIVLAPWFAFLNRDLAALSWNLGGLDAVAQATPLALLQQGATMPSYMSMFLGYPGGALAETSALALLIGAAYLIYKRHITWHIPVSILGVVVVLTVLSVQDPIYHLLSGGLLLGAFYMATDWVTSPINVKGKIVFGVGIGVLVVLFRLALAPTEGVAFSILIMNAFVPLIERVTKRASFSEPKPSPSTSGEAA